MCCRSDWFRTSGLQDLVVNFQFLVFGGLNNKISAIIKRIENIPNFAKDCLCLMKL